MAHRKNSNPNLWSKSFKKRLLSEVAEPGSSFERIARLYGLKVSQLLKRERIRRKTYATRKLARQDVFDYIEFFYNPKRKHGKCGMLSPIDFEKQQKWKLKGVYKIRGYSLKDV